MDRSPNSLQLRLLGGVELRSAQGQDLAVAGRKVRALLACLALSSGSLWPREKLMALLWSDRAEEQARASLRQALADLRRVLGEPSPLRTEHDTVGIDPVLIAVDAVDFARLAKAGKLNDAAALYRGRLLDGHGVRDGAFEDWLLVEGTRLHDLAIGVLDRLAASQSGDTAIETAQRLLQLDPVREETHRLLMRLYAAAGQRAQALRQYQHCRDTLLHELQAMPDAETERLYRQIQDEPMPGPVAIAAVIKAHSAAPLDSKPSVAVLPFTNMSGDPEQQYFSDGITEDIITELTRDHSLLVIARNSCFQFRESSADIAAIRQALGVRYVVGGSVRKAAERIRVTAQLTDGITQSHLWAERFDRDIRDVFAVQDEVTRAIVATLRGRIVASGAEQTRRKPTKDWIAYDYFLQGRDCDYRYDLKQAIDFFRRATELDRDYVHAHAWLATNLCIRYLLDERPETIEEAAVHAQRALTLDENDALAHDSIGWVALRRRQFDLAGQHFDRAVGLNPNDINVAIDQANWLMYVNRLEEALRCLDLVLQRDPYAPNYVCEVRGQTLYFLKRHEEAIAALRNMRAEYFWTHMFLAASFAQTGQSADARRELGSFLMAKPKASLDSVSHTLGYVDKAMRDHLLGGLRKAGLPE